MNVESNFTKRSNDIEETFNLIRFIVNIASHKNQPLVDTNGNRLFVTQEMQCALKAQFLIVLYNIVESTVCDCIYAFYDSIADNELTFADISDEMRTIWRNYLKNKSNPNWNKTDAELMNMAIRFEDLGTNISGSCDIRKIFEVFSKHGCYLNPTNRSKYADSFLTIKNRRNRLAHGNISFSECGSYYMVSDLEKFKNDILNGLLEVVTQSKDFISRQHFKRV